MLYVPQCVLMTTEDVVAKVIATRLGFDCYTVIELNKSI